MYPVAYQYYRCITRITITQAVTIDFVTRNKVLNFDFCHSFEVSDSWKDLTNKGTITLPKNIYYVDQNGKKNTLSGTNVNIGGFSEPVPLILRGDAITINAGYRYFNKDGVEVTDLPKEPIYSGFVSKVTSKKPFVLQLEDNMYKLKQVAVGTHTFTKKNTLEDILKFILKGTPYTVNALTQTTFGTFTIGHETAAQVLARLRKDYHFESYFRGNELRSGSLVYIESEAITHNFTFQKNIISDQLEYQRKDDLILSAIAHNTLTEDTGGTTKDGQAKTKKIRLEVLVTLFNGKELRKVIPKGERTPESTEGERRTLFFPGATTSQQLGDLAIAELKKYYYTGLKGKFTTFGIPFVKQGDNVNILDSVLPERNGLYKVKQADYKGGIEGLRQEITLDYLIQK